MYSHALSAFQVVSMHMALPFHAVFGQVSKYNLGGTAPLGTAKFCPRGQAKEKSTRVFSACLRVLWGSAAPRGTLSARVEAEAALPPAHLGLPSFFKWYWQVPGGL